MQTIFRKVFVVLSIVGLVLAGWPGSTSAAPAPQPLFAAPTDILLDGGNSDTVNENRLPGTVVGTLTTIDPDVGDTHTYTLVAGPGDTDNASFTINGDKLLLNTTPDFETQSAYSIRIRSTDSTGSTLEKTFTINVADIVQETDTAVSKVWRLDQTANYALSNPQKIEVTTGIARLVENAPVFDHYWAMDEASWNGSVGEVTDSADSGHGVAINGANTIPGGILNRGGSFSRAAKQYLDFGTSIANPGSGNFAFGIWFRTTNTTDDMSMMARSVYSAEDGRYALLINNGAVRILLDLGPNFIVSSPTATYNDGSWHLAVANVDRNGNLELYLDGALAASTSIAAYSAFDYGGLARNLFIGAYNSPSGIGVHSTFGYYDGDLDEAFFIRRTLTPAEISAIWNGGSGARLDTYNTSRPYVTASQAVSYPQRLTEFSEIATQNSTGNFVYQVSIDGGLTWQYWDGTAWTVAAAADSTQASAAAAINAHISSLDTDGGEFTWRAFLVSDGSQNTALDQITVNFLNPYPVVILGANTTPANGDILTPGPTQITVEFNMDVKSGGSAIPGAADNPANYLLVEAGRNSKFDTTACDTGLTADDRQIAIDNIVYDNTGPYLATLDINNGVPLPPGDYRLFICGTTSIENLYGAKLNNGLADTRISFKVQAPEALPDTGFAPGEITSLPAQPDYSAYTDTALSLVIPNLGVHLPIVGVPQHEQGWDVSWLGNRAGWLEGTAFPTWQGNTVITAHVWDAWNQPGPFADLRTLRYGDRIEIHAWGQTYIYEVRENRLLRPNQVTTALQAKEADWLTLITCEDYLESSEQYHSRRMVRAVLIAVR